MTSKEIKAECEQMYEQIANAEARLKLLRSYCLHGRTQIGLYEWRIGSTYTAEICKACGSVIRNLSYECALNNEFKTTKP